MNPFEVAEELRRKLRVAEVIKDASPENLANTIKVLMFPVQDALLFHFHNTTGALDRHGKTLTGDAHLTFRAIFVSCHMSSESVLFLIQCERLWDGERLMRSICEGPVRLLYMCQGSSEERSRRVKEYCEDYPGIEAIRRQKRLEAFFQEVADPDSDNWAPLREAMLPKEEFATLLHRFPGKERANLARKWSYAELLRSLSSEKELRPMTALLHTYGIGSSLMHHDSDAINITRDRTGRNDARRLSIEAAHGGRLLSDLLTMVHLRASAILKTLNADTTSFRGQIAKDKLISADIELIQKAWWAIETNSTEGPPGS